MHLMMTNPMHFLSRPSRGQSTLLITFALVALVGSLALTFDVTGYCCNRVRLQMAADSAALAGASEYVPNIPSPAFVAPGCGGPNVNAVACSYAVQNGALASETTVQSPSPTVPSRVPPGSQTVMVTIQRNTIPV